MKNDFSLKMLDDTFLALCQNTAVFIIEHGKIRAACFGLGNSFWQCESAIVDNLYSYFMYKLFLRIHFHILDMFSSETAALFQVREF